MATLEARLDEKVAQMRGGATVGQKSIDEAMESKRRIMAAKNDLAGVKLVDDSMFKTFAKGFKESMPLGEAMDIYEAVEDPFNAGYIEYFDEDGLPKTPEYVSPTDQFGSDFYDISKDQRRERVLGARRKELMDYYGSVASEGWSFAAGKVLGSMWDWTSLMPLGQGIKPAMLIGGSLAGLDVTAQQMATQGKLNPVHVTTAALLGAVSAGVLTFAGSKLTSWITDRTNSGMPITKDDVAQKLQQWGVPDSHRPDPAAMADELNKNFKITGEGYLKGSIQIVNDIKGKRKITSPLDAPIAINRLDRPLDVAILEQRMEAARINNFNMPDQTQKAMEIEEAWHTKTLSEMAKKEEAWQTKTLAERAKKEADVDVAWSFYNPDKAAKEIDQQNKVIARANKALELKEENRILKTIAGEIPPQNPTMKIALEQAFTKANVKSKKRQGEQADQFKSLSNKLQGGFAQTDFMNSLASGGIGALVGFGASGGSGEWAAFGAIAGMGVPYYGTIYQKMRGRVGKARNPIEPPTPQQAEEQVQKFVDARFFAKPETAFRSWGSAGQEFGERFKRANEGLNATIGKNLMEMNKAFYGAGLKTKKYLFDKESPEYRQIPDILRKILPEKDATPEAKAAAGVMRNIFNKTLDDAVEVGTIDKETAKILRQRAEKEGYFPRVWDEFYLNSKEGREKWTELTTRHHWTPKQAEDAAETILGTKPGKGYIEGKFINVNKKTGEKALYKMPKAMAEKLYERRREISSSQRSNHLQKKRTIKLPDEVLKPFLVNDPSTVMAEYLRDTYKAIHLARQFGNKDQIALKYFDEIENISPEFRRQAQEVYYTMAGDASSSETIRQFVRMPDSMKRTIGQVTSYETLKLTFAPIVNSTQATVNGIAALERFTKTPMQSLKLYRQALRESMTQEGKDFAERIGATAESSLMTAMGDMSASQHAIFHKNFEGVFTPLNYVNQPAKYLRMIGFQDVERMQRVLGANMGKALIESILEEQGDLIAKQATRNLSKRDQARFKKNQDTLVEFGITPEGTPAAAEVERAAQRFSNEINFINAPDQMPIAFQSPYLKPFMQFKSFVVKHTAFLKKTALDPIIKNPKDINSYRPLAAYLGVGVPAGMAVNELRMMLMGDDKDLTWVERGLKGLTSIGGLGLMYDIAINSAYSDAGLLSWAAGPAANDVSGMLHGGVEIITGLSGEETARRALQTLPPFFGKAALKDELFKKSQGSKSYYEGLYGGEYSNLYQE